MSTLVKDDYFLSASNPLANVDQRDLEALAVRVFETGEMLFDCFARSMDY